jgi:hypothetical protein
MQTTVVSDDGYCQLIRKQMSVKDVPDWIMTISVDIRHWQTEAILPYLIKAMDPVKDLAKLITTYLPPEYEPYYVLRTCNGCGVLSSLSYHENGIHEMVGYLDPGHPTGDQVVARVASGMPSILLSENNHDDFDPELFTWANQIGFPVDTALDIVSNNQNLDQMFITRYKAIMMMKERRLRQTIEVYYLCVDRVELMTLNPNAVPVYDPRIDIEPLNSE